MKTAFKLAALALSLSMAGAATAQENLLMNPSFEQSGALATGWVPFGNVFREHLLPITGEYSIKLFGNFQPNINYSGIYQDFAATGGQEWTAHVTGTNPALDALQGGNRALLKLEFYDASDALLGSGETEVLTAATPVGVPQPAMVSTAAPPGTTHVRLILLFEQQADMAGGSAFFDDVSAEVLGMGAVAVTNPSFEEGTGVLPGWGTFNNAVRTTNGPRTGEGNLTLTSGTNSGVFQDFPAIPGSVWHGSVWGLNSSTSEPLILPDYVLANIEWRDAGGNVISFETSLVLDGLSPLDSYAQVEVGGTAPEGTAIARFVLIYIYAGGTGTVQLDDASFEQISSPPPPPPSSNLLNNPGFELPLGFDFANVLNWNGFFGGPAGTFLQAFNNTGAEPHSGFQALVTTIRQGTAVTGFDSFTGHVQNVPNIIGGQRYELSVWARANPIVDNGAEFRVEWQNAAGVEVGRLNTPIESLLTNQYQQFTATAVAPPDATQAKIVVAVQSFIHSMLTFADTSVAWDDVFFGVPACPADFNADGDLNPDDLGDYINCYFALPPCDDADFNHDGDTNPDDLGDFINSYFGGC